MPTPYVVTLLVAIVVVVLMRLLLPALPLRSMRFWPSRIDVILTVLGLVGLGLHCGAMFYRSAVLTVPGTDGLVRQINALGAVSMCLYALPALLLLVGLRSARTPLLVATAVALVAVGVTMYDGGPLDAHLTAIAAAVLLILITIVGSIGKPVGVAAAG